MLRVSARVPQRAFPSWSFQKLRFTLREQRAELLDLIADLDGRHQRLRVRAKRHQRNFPEPQFGEMPNAVHHFRFDLIKPDGQTRHDVTF